MSSVPSFEQFDVPNTLEKYMAAGRVVSKVLNEVLKKIEPDVLISEAIRFGEMVAEKELVNVFSKIKDKGFCLPLTISRNQIIGKYHPEDGEKIKDGDLLKIDLGIHIDGYPNCCCYTHLVKTEGKLPEEDPRSRVLSAAIEASREVVSLVKPENTNIMVVEKLEEIASRYGCQLTVADMQYPHAPGVISYQMSRGVIDGMNDDEDDDIHKLILQRKNGSFDFDLRETEFEINEVYCLDLAFSSGSGRLRPLDKTTVFRRNPEKFHNLRLKASRETLATIGHSGFPVDCSQKMTPRFRMGLTECLRNDLVDPYQPMTEKEGEYLAQVKFTVVVRRKNKKNKRGHILLSGRSGEAELEKIGTDESSETPGLAEPEV